MDQNALRSVNDGLQQVVSCNRIESAAMLDHIDARLQNMQQRILSSIPIAHKRKFAKRSRGRQFTASLASMPSAGTKDDSARDTLVKEEVTSQCTTYLMRVIKPGILITESNGQLHRKLVAVPVLEYDESSLLEKQSFVQQIQGLRVVIWLLKRDPFIPARTLYGARKFSSELLLQGNMNRDIEVKDYMVALIHGVRGTMDRSTLIFLAERLWIWEYILMSIFKESHEFVRFIGDCINVSPLRGRQLSEATLAFSHWLALYQSPKPPIKLSRVGCAKFSRRWSA